MTVSTVAEGWKIALDADQALLASFKVSVKKFNELLHPRGADGRFISKSGRVKWKDSNSELWVSGDVVEISKDKYAGSPLLSVKKSNGAVVSISANKAYGAKSPVAKLSNSFKSSLHQLTGKQGTNPGGLYETPDKEVKYYVKEPYSDKHVINELVAHKLYAAVGAATPEVGMSDDKKNFFSKIEESVAWSAVDGPDKDKVLDEIRKNFVVDAWLANWDAPVTDNIRVTKDGVPLRVDVGGALDYRAQGKSKIDQLTPEVKELKTLRDPITNWNGAKLYGPTTKEQELDGVKRILALTPASIRELVTSEGAPERLADDLIARRAWLATEYGLQLPETTPKGKSLLADHAAEAGDELDSLVEPSLAPAIKKLEPGEKPALGVGSPVWLKNKEKYGSKLGDVWAVESVEEDDSSVALKSIKGSNKLVVDKADVEALRSNHLSVDAKYSDGSIPSIGDHVILTSGDEGEVKAFYPKYAKVSVTDGEGKTKNKVVAVSKLSLKNQALHEAEDADSETDDLLPTSTGVGIYTGEPYSPKYADAQAEMLKSAVNAIEDYENNGKKSPEGQYSVSEATLMTNALIPTQTAQQTADGGSGKGPSGMKPIAAVTPEGHVVLLDGHHRASKQETIDAYVVLMTTPAAVNSPSLESHDWTADPNPEVSYPKPSGEKGHGKVSLYNPALPKVIVQTELSDPDSIEFYDISDLSLYAPNTK